MTGFGTPYWRLLDSILSVQLTVCYHLPGYMGYIGDMGCPNGGVMEHMGLGGYGGDPDEALNGVIMALNGVIWRGLRISRRSPDPRDPRNPGSHVRHITNTPSVNGRARGNGPAGTPFWASGEVSGGPHIGVYGELAGEPWGSWAAYPSMYLYPCPGGPISRDHY